MNRLDRSENELGRVDTLNKMVEIWGFDNLIHNLYTETTQGKELFIEYMFGYEWDSIDRVFENPLCIEYMEVYKTLPLDTQITILDELDCIDVDMLIRCRIDYDLSYPEMLIHETEEFDEDFIKLMTPYVREVRLEGLGL